MREAEGTKGVIGGVVALVVGVRVRVGEAEGLDVCVAVTVLVIEKLGLPPEGDCVALRVGEIVDVAGGGVIVPVTGGGVTVPVIGGGVTVPVTGGGVTVPVIGGGVTVPVSGGGVTVPVMAGGVTVPVSGGGVTVPVTGGGVIVAVANGVIDGVETEGGLGVADGVAAGAVSVAETVCDGVEGGVGETVQVAVDVLGVVVVGVAVGEHCRTESGQSVDQQLNWSTHSVALALAVSRT